MSLPPVAVPPVDGGAVPPDRAVDTTRAAGGTATLLSVSAGLVGLTSYACTLVMAHLLDPVGYTSFAAAAALVGTAGVASAALVPLPLAHAVRSNGPGSARRRDATTFAAGVSVVVGLLAGLVLALLTSRFADPATAVAAGVAGLALFAIAPVWGHLQGEARFTRYAMLTVGEVLVRLAASVLLVLAGAGAAGAVGAFAVGALLVVLAATTGPMRSLSARALPRVLADRARWAETGGVAAVQAVLSALAVADVVVVALVLGGADDLTAAAGYQAVAALAKAPVYVAVGTALVSFPALRASTGAVRDAHLAAALTTFVRLVVPAAAVVATVPPALAGIVLPAEYTPALALLPWLAVAGAGLGATTVLATLLLALGARRALLIGLGVAALALAAGLVGGPALAADPADGAVGSLTGAVVDPADATAGLARGVALGALVGALAVALAGRRHRPRGTVRRPVRWTGSAVRGGVYAAVVLAALLFTRPSVVAWVLAVGVVGLAVVVTPVLAGRLRAAADPGTTATSATSATSAGSPAPGALHVLHLGFEDPEMPGSGGGATRTAQIDRRLAAAGHRITVVTTRFPGARDRTEHLSDGHGTGTVRWVHVGVGRGSNRLTRLLGYVVALPFAVRSIDADVVVEDFFAPVSSIGVPWFSPRPTAGIVQWLNAREKAREYKVPVHWVERVAVRSHRHLVAMSRGVADELALLAPRAEVAVIGNGVDAAAFATRPVPVEQRRDVVFVGRLETAQKGLDLLVDAWARVAPLVGGRLVVAGTGPDEAALRERVARAGVGDRVHFAGWVSGAAKHELYSGAAVVAVPSRFETFGIVAVEALAAGTPVVAFDIDCLREVVPTAAAGAPDAGVLVPRTGDHDTDVTTYATALHAAVNDSADSADSAGSVGSAVRRTAAAEGPRLAAVHDWDALAAAQEAFLRRVAGGANDGADDGAADARADERDGSS